jgi:lipid II:glycine glycyltransferase (peptidoglycan interpeptide bridge formation enzyme)
MGSQSGQNAGREAPSARNLFQSPFWAAQKERFGWRPLVSPEGELLLHRKLPGPFSLFYVPYGGTGGADSATHLPPGENFDLSDYLHRLVTAAEIVAPTFLRWDVPFPTECVGPERLEAAGLEKAVSDVQPPDTVVLDLRQEEEALLGGMKGKTRYNVRLAEKRGVSVEAAEPEEALAAWYELYRLTAGRDRIAIHSYDYYRSLFEVAREGNCRDLSLRLYLARHEGDLLAGIITARYRGSAYYLYGASSNEKRNLMPAYALQWRAIRDARREGANWYDFFGIPPAEDASHPMHGLYRFKTGFGGAIVHRPGAWDLPLRPLAYRAFRLAEGGRTYYYKVLRKRGG